MEEILKDIKDKKLKYSDILRLCKINQLEGEYKNIYCEEIDKCYFIYQIRKNDFLILFDEEVNLKIVDSSDKYYEKKILCNIEIFDYLKELGIKDENIIINDDKNLLLIERKSQIHKYVKDNILILNELKINIPFIKTQKIFHTNIIKPKEYSEYFYDYFEYEKEREEIKYYQSKIRADIRDNINLLGLNEKLRKYKITGPSSNGKSFTLFYISRIKYNTIYINLKALKKNSFEKGIGMIISECSRLALQKDILSNLNEKIQKIKSKTILEFLLKVIELILKCQIQRLILILDQFKKENYKSFPNFKNDIENLMNENHTLKVVYCASLNDNELRDEILLSFIKYNGFIEEYNEKSQDSYFYYMELYRRKSKNRNTINWLFNNKPKYISLFNKNKKKGIIKEDTYSDIMSRIETKIQKFKASSLGTFQSEDSFSLSDILIYLRDIFGEKFEKRYICEVLKFCPLKYLKIKFTEDYFIIKPIYPFFKYFIDKTINKEECITFFKKKKYNSYGFQTNRLKGKYFEYSVQIALKNNKIIKLPNKENREITLYEISTMNKFSELIYDKMNDYYIEEDKDDEQEENKQKSNVEEENTSDEEDKSSEVEINNYDDEEEKMKKKKKKVMKKEIKKVVVKKKKKTMIKKRKILMKKIQTIGKIMKIFK